MKDFPPKAFIIGAQKCGTTSLAFLLNQNPEICLSDPKEPNYYTVNYNNGLEWYSDRFSDHRKVLVDASTTYTMCPLSPESLSYKKGRGNLLSVPERIYNDSPDAKIIYIIREPVARMYSNYWHNIKYGYENNTFMDAIKLDPLYIEMSKYYEQIKKYLEYFDSSNILIIKFEDYIKNKLSTLNECEKFIGVSATNNIIDQRKDNKGGQYGKIGKALMRSSIISKLEKYISSDLKRILKKMIVKDIPKLSSDVSEELFPIFIEDLQSLEHEFNKTYKK